MFSYGTAETVLAKLHGADAESQSAAFRGRLKHLKRLGIPQGVNPGRGAKIWYEDAHVFEWAFCLELAEFGLDPSVIVAFVKDHWDRILPRLLREQRSPSIDNDLYFVVRPKLMAAAWEGTPASGALPFAWLHRREQGHRILDANRRTILINVTTLVRELSLLRVNADTVGRKEA